MPQAMENKPSPSAFPDHVAAVIVAAGRGERAGAAGGPKQYRQIAGKAIIAQTLDEFLNHPRINTIVVAIHRDDDTHFAEAVGDRISRVQVVHGGATRQESTRIALAALEDTLPDAVLIHDGVRPFVDAGLIDRTIDALTPDSGALPALSLVDTIKRRGEDNLVSETVSRDGLFSAQTPQGFPYLAILAAHQAAGKSGRSDFTDDASIAEWAALPVLLIEGSPDNVKLTWPKDIEMAEQKLTGATFPDVRTGNGYDVHAFEPGDHVTLCGVKIPHSMRLNGHSDADVGLHALTDALLATCGAGDIGTHFPPTDPRWRGAASKTFVEYAAKIVRDRGGRIANADVTLICEAPKIGPHRAAMTDALTAMLGVSADRVSIKATTNERLGFIGREEGIAAIATATVVYPGRLPDA
jgi:2-C-methyl-D-erythritol 4-phosphate cytidylyltransferase/2-C-methyl-D-erythritol 2,4-cyclodiphosphate synthase